MSTENYTPFGEEWKKEMMKWKKEDLIDFLKTKLEAQSQVKNNVALGDVMQRSEQLKCEHKGRRTATELVEYCEDCKKILYHP